ncbi:MAG: 5-amino-6-(D-ribitylamino)uracil--L-tyrosine 4-hydroxyphenyl transferase CofH [Pseudomonadota bacterium]
MTDSGSVDIDIEYLVETDDIFSLMAAAREKRDAAFGSIVTYSPKVFIPLTKACRDVCHYCTFAKPLRRGQTAYLSPEQVLDIARRGERAGCHEALFTLGEKPELRYRTARSALEALGFETTIDYLAHVAALVRDETTLLPHLNPGTLTVEEFEALRPVAASMGMMLETSADRLSEKGGPHYGSPDKDPKIRLAALDAAGKAKVPFTTGLLIGIGETRRETVDAILKIRDSHAKYGHVQEVIVQNFLPKPDTKMRFHPPADPIEHQRAIAIARLLLQDEVSIQAPPNLAAGTGAELIEAGINDWGGVSPVTIDHVNPEAPWPSLEKLAAISASKKKTLAARLTIYPRYAQDAQAWIDRKMRQSVLRASDADGLAFEGHWVPGALCGAPAILRGGGTDAAVQAVLELPAGKALTEEQVVTLFEARGDAFYAVCRHANELRKQINGDTVRYVVTRNINYTNVCTYGCKFCAFSKGKTSKELRGPAYDLDMEEFSRRVSEAWSRGATEICLQGGIHPDYTGETYLALLRHARQAAPNIHIHAFSPLEIWQGAKTLDLPLTDYLRRLKDAGLSSLPGTAAEILDDEIRDFIAPDKIKTDQWFAVMRAAHSIGLKSTSTIMFGHVERPVHWARHLLRLRSHQLSHGGFTEFVPLPFVALEAPMFLRGQSRKGPTWREAVLMHAVARIVLQGAIDHIQASWVKMGPEGAATCLDSGADDMGGTLMNESITRAAGAVHGQEFAPWQMEDLIRSVGRAPVQRTTLYGLVPEERRRRSMQAAPLEDMINTPFSTKRRRRFENA